MEEHQKDLLRKIFQGELLFDVPLKNFVSFRVGGPAEVIAFPRDHDDLVQLLGFVRKEKVPFLVLGEGTNLLVRDSGVKGVVVKLSSGFNKIEVKQEKGGKVIMQAQAGIRLFFLIERALQHSLTGLEFASGIPGSVGGALVMNAGAYGGEIKDVVHSVTMLSPEGAVRRVPKEELRFSYRKLELSPDAIILAADFEMHVGDKNDIAAQIKEKLERRKKKQPLDLPSAGSVFKNPPGLYAAQVIEEAGLKGYQMGGACVSERHANFIVNRGTATAHDITALISFIQETIWKEKGIKLETEIRVVGDE